jgi:hypothetical protein
MSNGVDSYVVYGGDVDQRGYWTRRVNKTTPWGSGPELATRARHKATGRACSLAAGRASLAHAEVGPHRAEVAPLACWPACLYRRG